MNFSDWISSWNFIRIDDISSWLVSLGVFIATLTVLRIIKAIISRKISNFANKTQTTIDDLLADLVEKTKLFSMLAVSIYLASIPLNFPSGVAGVIEGSVVIICLLQIAIWGNLLIGYLISCYVSLESEEQSPAAASTTALTFIGKLIVCSLLLLVGLDNFGFDITALVASFGIGGIAVALAAQNILGDLFASLSIMLDKPFVVGDFIIIDEYMGSVEYIGLKTTRIRSLSGEQLVFSNTDLLKSRVRNFKRMQERRAIFAFGVTYQTPYEKLVAIPKIVQEIIESQKSTRFDRAHFKEYGDFALNFEVVYWVKAPDHKLYMDIQQNINLSIFQRFENECIEFAFPTQTLFLNKEALPKE